MSSNLYAPPSAEVRDPPPQAWSSSKAVFIGLLVDIGGSTIASLLLSVVYGIVLGASGMTTEGVMEEIGQIRPWTPIYLLYSAVGCAMSVVGGFVCTRRAQRSDLRLGLIMACLSVLFGLLLSSRHSSWTIHAILAAATFASVLVGARLGFVSRGQTGERR